MSKIFEGYTAQLLALVILLLLVFYAYKKYVAPFTVFPQSWAIVKIVAHFLTGRIPKDTTVSCFAFETVVKDLKKHASEGYCVFWLPKPYVVIYNELAVEILNNAQLIVNKADAYHVLRDSYRDGIVTSDEELWRKQRKLIQPAFHSSLLKHNIPNFSRNANKLVESLMEAKNEPVKIIQFLKKCTFDNLMESVFGLELDNLIESGEQDKMMPILDRLGTLVAHRMLNPLLGPKSLLPYSTTGRAYIENLENGLATAYKFVLQTKDLTVKRLAEKQNAEDEDYNGASLRKSFVEILVDAHLKDPSFTMKEVNEESVSLIAAGYDTVAHALLWCLFELGHHPEVQDQIYDEVEHLKGEEITYDDVKNLRYTECVIKEALRLHPGVPFYGRRLSADVQCGKYFLPKNTNVVLFSYMLHRNPKVYPDPEKFDPERFRNGTNDHPWSYTPFADGVRDCVGKKYAMIQMKIIVAYLIQNFRLKSLQRIEDVKSGWDIVLVANKPILMSFKPRNSISQKG